MLEVDVDTRRACGARGRLRTGPLANHAGGRDVVGVDVGFDDKREVKPELSDQRRSRSICSRTGSINAAMPASNTRYVYVELSRSNSWRICMT